VPATVRDAVLARADRLSPGARHLLEAAAVIGSPAESWLVTSVSQASPRAAEECISQGLLLSRGDSLSFRHELARNAVLEAVSAPQQIDFHRRALAALRDFGSTDLSRLSHHAVAAFDRDAVLEYGVAAAQRAASFRSHREAAAQYERVMHYAGALPLARRAELLMAWSFELSLLDRTDQATATCLEALELWRALGDRLREGDALRWLARTYWYAGRNTEAAASLAEALDILEALPPSPELAMAYSARAQLHMLAWDTGPAIAWGDKAIRLAEELNEYETLSHALANVGAALMMFPEHLERSQALLDRALELALRENMEEHAARVSILISTGRCEMYSFAVADQALAEGIAYAAEHDLDTYLNYQRAWRGLSLFYRGHWAAAAEQETEVLRQPRLGPPTRIVALAVLGRVHVRQGSSAATGLLDEALELAAGTDELQRLCPVRTALAEQAWLAGNLDRVRAEAESIYDMALLSKHRWYIGQLAYWLWRAGALECVPDDAFEPYVLQIEGNWREAAAAWRSLGCPYEAAWALVDSDSEPELRYAHAEFLRLGAAPAAAIALRRLRELGVERLPRGPRPSTQANPFQLTSRELEVLALIVQGQRTQDIADALFLSPRTVSHHITAILAKLHVHSRDQAARKAEQLGILSQSGYLPSPN
jgi:DNA-binding CsgD family transcriptional regulator/tetratricopeptide (TPR) repeat protein